MRTRTKNPALLISKKNRINTAALRGANPAFPNMFCREAGRRTEAAGFPEPKPKPSGSGVGLERSRDKMRERGLLKKVAANDMTSAATWCR